MINLLLGERVTKKRDLKVSAKDYLRITKESKLEPIEKAESQSEDSEALSDLSWKFNKPDSKQALCKPLAQRMVNNVIRHMGELEREDICG